MIDWSLVIVVVKSRRNVLRRDYCYVTDIIKEKRSKLPSMSRSATKARVLLLHSGSIYLREHNTIPDLTHLSAHNVQPGPPYSLFSSFTADCSTEQAFLTHLDFSVEKSSARRELMTDTRRVTSPTIIALFMLLALLPGDLELLDATRIRRDN